MCILDHTSFFNLLKFLKKLAADQCSSITKGSIYYMKHVHIQTSSMEVNWPETWHLVEVFMFCTCFYFVGKNTLHRPSKSSLHITLIMWITMKNIFSVICIHSLFGINEKQSAFKHFVISYDHTMHVMMAYLWFEHHLCTFLA